MPECDGPPVFIRPTSGLVLPQGAMRHRAPLGVPSALRSFRVSAALFTTTASADFSPALAVEISPGKDLNFPRIPSGSTLCVLMSFGLCVYADARRPQQASLPVRVPMVAGLPSPSFILRLTASDLEFGYGCSHQLRCHRFMFISSGPCRAHEYRVHPEPTGYASEPVDPQRLRRLPGRRFRLTRRHSNSTPLAIAHRGNPFKAPPSTLAYRRKSRNRWPSQTIGHERPPPSTEFPNRATLNRMSPALEQLKKEISQLPPSERHALWRSLNEEFDPQPNEEDDEASIEAAWDEEIANRVQEIKDGTVQLLSSEDFESQIQTHLIQLRANRKPQST